MQVDVVTCILFVIQDMQEGDMLCGFFGSHGSGIQQHCHACDVNHEHLDNPNINCTFLEAYGMSNIACHTDKGIRKRWSQHQLNNVFDYILLADPIHGIYGATPVETMHAFRKGMIEVVTVWFLKMFHRANWRRRNSRESTQKRKAATVSMAGGAVLELQRSTRCTVL